MVTATAGSPEDFDFKAAYLLVVGIPILLGAVAVAAYFYFRYAARVRRDELSALAVAQKLAFEPAPSNALCQSYADFAPFKGRREWAENLMHGVRDGVHWQVFDYTYSTGRRSQQHYRFSIVAADVARRFPDLRIRPERWYDALAKMAGWHDVTLGWESFDRRFHVTSVDPDAARKILGSDVVKYLTRLPDYHWQFSGNKVVIHRRGRLAPARIPEVTAAMVGLLAVIPDSVAPPVTSLDEMPPAGAAKAEDDRAGPADDSVPMMGRGLRYTLLALSTIAGIGLLILVISTASQGKHRRQHQQRYEAVATEIAERKSVLARLERRAQEMAASPAPATEPTTVPMRDGRIDSEALRNQMEQIQERARREALLTQLTEVRRRLTELESEREQLERNR